MFFAAAAHPLFASALATMLSHMRTASGPVWARTIQSTEAPPNSQITLQRQTHGLLFLSRRCYGAICGGTYFDGEHLYAIDMNGTALPIGRRTRSELRALRIAAGETFLDPSFSRQGGTIADGGTLSGQGRTLRVLDVRDNRGTAVEIYVDPSTWLIAGMRTGEGALYALRDYRRAGGLTLPFEIDRDTIPIVRFTARSADDAPLVMPHGIDVSQRGPPLPLPTDPSMQTPLVNCTFDGIPVRCLIDSGNSSIALSLDLVERLKLHAVGSFEVNGLGRYATEVVNAGPLQVGNLTFPRANYVVLDDIAAYGYDVVLGADAIAASPVTIDFANHTVAFGAPPVLAGGTVSLPLRFDDFVPIVGAKLGALQTRLAVDTGDQSNINLSYAYYAQHRDLFTPTRVVNVAGVGGESVEEIGRIASVTLGPLTMRAQAIGATRTLLSGPAGRLGAAFLANFRVTLDYQHASLYLTPR